jgi:hypothetical protein
MQPLGLLSLVTLANGVFATIRFRSSWTDTSVGLDDVGTVQARDVIVLADRVQQVSIEVVDGLAQMIASSPLVTSSTATALLMSLLLRRIKNRRDNRKLPFDD